MPTLNLNQANKLYWGNTEVQKLYKGNQQLLPSVLLCTYWRVDYDYILSEIQLEENSNGNPIVLNTPDITFTRLSSVPPTNVGLLNDNTWANQRIGNSSTQTLSNHSYQIKFSSPKNITGVFLAPQFSGSTIYNPCTYCRLYYKVDEVGEWNLLKEWVVTSPFVNTISSPYANTLLRPNQLIKLSV